MPAPTEWRKSNLLPHSHGSYTSFYFRIDIDFRGASSSEIVEEWRCLQAIHLHNTDINLNFD